MTNNIPEHFRRRIQEAKEQQLEELDLSSDWDTDDKDKLTKIPEEVFELTHLKVLTLSHNNISSLPEYLGYITNLTKLDLEYNQLNNLPESLVYLINLTALDLRMNQLRKLPESLGCLINLTTLRLGGNQLTELPDFLGNLTNLTTLDLRDNQLTELPDSLGSLSNLNALYLGNNQLTRLPESLGNLSNLNALYLGNNQLIKLPGFLGNLSNLNTLNLVGNQLTELPDFLGNLTNLTTLYLRDNQLSELPNCLGNLTNLITLYLGNNQLKTLPESLINLLNLNTIYLGDNQLKTLPESLENTNNLNKLYLDNNPLIEPPIEVAKQGIEGIRNYFRQIKAEGLDYIYEAKLLIVGEPGAGKTTLAKKIDKPDYELQPREPSTEGIDIIKYTFPCSDSEQNQRDFTVNIWDFGGQEIYHATHQFFLTKRSLYALVADTRKEDTDFYYWLNVVELLSDNSPLLIINNEKQNRKREINETALRGQFINLEKTLATDLATNRGLKEILTDIKHYIQKLPHVGETLPRTWVKVRQTLEQDKRNYISLQDYLDICEHNGFTRHEDKLQLSQYLHDLGVCLHFQDEEDSPLYKTVILKPTWGTDAVYKVLDNPQIINHQGRFSRNDLKNILYEEKYASMRGELLELMKKFQLCYQIPGNKNVFIAPQLLSDNQPEYDWNQASNLILRYTYPDFMPKGIITRFIVVMHQYIDQQKYVWKSGVILSKDDTKVEVIEYYGRREIKIRVTGKNKRDLVTIVTYEIDKISNSYKRLKYQKLIPCDCLTCINSQDPHEYDFNYLLARRNANKRTVECHKEPFLEVKVSKLLDNSIELEKPTTQAKQDSNQTININVTQENRNIKTDSGNYNESIEGNYNQSN